MQSTPHTDPDDVRVFRRRPANAIPQLSAWREWGIRALTVATLVYWTWYIAWRWTSTLNPDALWFSVPLVLAETWGLVAALLMAHSVWALRRREPPSAPEGMRVDVFITCYDEPLEVVRRTAAGARAIRYPHRTWILDDGKRDELKEMAERMGLGYLRREGNEHAKAGNLNHALRHTDGDFVLQLDADHVPLPHVLDRLLGYLARDPRLAFVQSPQDFYNADGFTFQVDETRRRMWEEQRLFFGVIQPGKDRVNGAFFCGSCAVIRRAALDEVGGISTDSITEDIETSLKLHAAGWRSAFHGESLAYGLAAGSAAAFHTQHLRWGQGAMQVLRKYNPLTLPGLTLHQRVSYLGSLTAYFGGPQKLVFFLAPIVYFLTGVLPIASLDREFLARFLPFLALSLATAVAQGRGRASLWVTERYHMVKFWTYTRAVLAFFSRKPRRFHVTPKGPGHVPFRTYAPQVALLAATLASLAWGTLAQRAGWLTYAGAPEGWGSLAFVTNGVWAALNAVLAASVVRLSLRVRQQRADHRFRDRFPVSVRLAGPGGRREKPFVALAEDLNTGGMALRSGRELPEGRTLALELPLSTGTVRARGTVVQSAPARGADGVRRYGLRFEPLSLRDRDAVELHCTQHAVPLEQAQYRYVYPLTERLVDWIRDARRERRRRVRLPARVTLSPSADGAGEAGHAASLEELSRNGARLVMDHPVAPGTRLRLRVPGTPIRRTGTVVFSHAFQTPLGTRFAVGVARERPAGAAAWTRVRRLLPAWMAPQGAGA